MYIYRHNSTKDHHYKCCCKLTANGISHEGYSLRRNSNSLKNIVLFSFRIQQCDRCKILHMAGQMCYRAMCESLLWSDNRWFNYNKAKFPPNFNWERNKSSMKWAPENHRYTHRMICSILKRFTQIPIILLMRRHATTACENPHSDTICASNLMQLH